MMDISYMEVGDLIAKNLETLIEEKDLNPSAVAKAAGMGHTGVRDIITRKSKNPAYATLVKLAEVIGVDVTAITVGPSSAPLTIEEREWLDLWSRLSAEERQFLKKTARAVASPPPEEES